MPTQSQPAALPKHTPHKPEKGSASLLIELEDSAITVKHGTDGDILTSPRNVRAGYWDALFDLLEKPEVVIAHPALVAENKRLREALEAALPLITKAAEDAEAAHYKAVGGPREFASEVDYDVAARLLESARAALAKEDV